ERRPRGNDGMTESRCPGVAVAGGAAAWIRLAADGNDDLGRDQLALVGDKAQAARWALQLLERFVGGELRAAVMKPPEESVQNIGGTIADRKNLARFFDLRRHAFIFDQLDQVGGRQCGQRGMQEAALLAKGANDSPLIGRVREVAARAARQ